MAWPAERLHVKCNDNAASTVVDDSSIYNTDGTLNGGDNTSTITTTGKVSSALALNGTDDYIDFGNVANISGSYSVFLWLKTTDTTGIVISKLNTVGGSYWYIYCSPTGKLNCRIDGSTADADATSTASINDGTFKHVGFVWNGTTLTNYINGAVDGTNTPAAIGSASNVGSLTVGRWYPGDSGGLYLTETVDDIRIYDHALDSAQISAIYNSGNGTESSLSDLGSDTTVTATARDFELANSESFSITDAAQTGLDPAGNVDFYLAAWVKLESEPAASAMSIMAKYDFNSDQRCFRLEYDTTADRFLFRVSGNGTAAQLTTVTANTFGAVTTATWYFVQAYHDATNDVIAISVDNGTFDTAAHSTGVADKAVPFFIGNNSNAQPWDGLIQSALFVTGGIPSAANRTALYNAGAGVFYRDRPTLSAGTYISWWDLVETSGVALDALGVNNLTDNNTVTSAVGLITYTAEDASQFTAANTEWLSIADASQTGLDIGNADKYFCAWIYLDSLGVLRQIVSKWLVNATTQQSYTFYISAANQLVWIVSKDGTTVNNVSCTASEVVVASKWYFCEVWHNATTDLIGASLNRGTEATAAITTGVNDGTRDFTISMFSPDYPFNGRISSVVVTNGIPTSTERDSLYNRGFGVDYSDRPTLSSATYVSWWELTEASGSRADSHGSNTLTDNNTVTGNPGVVYDVPAAPVGGSFIQSRPISLRIGLGL